MDLSEAIDAVTTLDPRAPSFLHEGAWWTWGELRAVMDRVNEVLDEHGVGPDQAIGVVPQTNVPSAAAVLGALVGRRTIVTLSQIQSDAGLARDIRKERLAAVIADHDVWGRDGVADAIRAHGTLGVELTGDPADPVRVRVAAVRHDRPRQTAEPGVAVQMLTSGTTGPPKRVPLRYSTLETALLGAAHYSSGESDAGFTPRLGRSSSIITVPLVHISGLYTMVASVVAGRKTALLGRFKVEPWVGLVEELQPPAASLPPTCVRMLADAKVDPARIASLRALRVGTAPLDPDLAERFEDFYGIPLLAVYGATEFSGAVIGWTLDLHREWIARKRGSAGRAHPGIELRVVDPDTGESLSRGEVGLLEVRGGQAHGDVDEWVRTTDLALIDEDDFVWIRGRADDTIIRGGFKVALTKVRKVLERHPDVAEAAVVGLDDERLGQVPAAIVEPSPGHAPPASGDLMAWCHDHLSKYEVPVQIKVVDALPRNPSLKVPRPAVLEILDVPT